MSERAEKKRKNAAVNYIDYIHKNYISLKDIDMKQYVDHFRKVLQHIVTLMKEEDPLFKATFREICGAGSYYDGLKVGKPEEFDMDVVISLPVNYKEINIVNEDVVPAFTNIQMKRPLELLRQHPKWTEVFRYMDSWIDDDGFLLQNKFRQWIEGVVNKTLNKYAVKENCYKLIVCDPADNSKETEYMVSLKKSGPAMTFLITMPDQVQVDVDFVPVIEFTYPQWPPDHVRKLPDKLKKRTKWFIVPKQKKTNNPDHRIWRLAFHEQEREMINNKGVLKPVCRMLKKFRDVKDLNIASYYLKTLFLWEIDAHPEIEFWRKTHIDLFLYMLDKLEKDLRNGSIPYYWDNRYDLLEGMDKVHKENLANRLNKIISEMTGKLPEEPLIIAKHLLSDEEYKSLQSRNIIPATALTPAKPASTPQASTTHEKTNQANVPLRTSTVVSTASQETVSDEEYKSLQSRNIIPATALTPAKPASTPQASTTHEKTNQANVPMRTSTVVSTASQETGLAECSFKLNTIVDILNTLVVKVNSLERMMADIQNQNANLKDELRLARQLNS